MLTKVILAPISALLNRVIKADQDWPILIKPLIDHPLTIELTDINLCFTLIPSIDGFSIMTQVETAAVLAGKTYQVLDFALKPLPIKALQTQHVCFEGDLSILEAYRNFFKALNVDLSSLLPLPSALSHDLMRPLKKLGTHLHHRLNATQQDITEYCQEERRLLPTRIEFEAFSSEVAELRDAVERLSINLERTHP